jgi:hypothetical protein
VKARSLRARRPALDRHDGGDLTDVRVDDGGAVGGDLRGKRREVRRPATRARGGGKE